MQTLNQINRAFYSQFAEQFASSRSLQQPSLRRILEYISAAPNLLDVGCGNGRLAQVLNRERPGSRYLGLDFSSRLIRQARDRAGELSHIETRFAEADLTSSEWSHSLPSFDAIVALAVLHHIPAYRNRLRLVRTLADHLAEGGRLIVSVWQFTTNERMRRKIVPWDRVGLQPLGLEERDFLLDWKRGGLGYRYCHLVDEAELEQLAEDSDLVLLDVFRADGREGDLSLFGILAA